MNNSPGWGRPCRSCLSYAFGLLLSDAHQHCWRSPPCVGVCKESERRKVRPPDSKVPVRPARMKLSTDINRPTKRKRPSRTTPEANRTPRAKNCFPRCESSLLSVVGVLLMSSSSDSKVCDARRQQEATNQEIHQKDSSHPGFHRV